MTHHSITRAIALAGSLALSSGPALAVADFVLPRDLDTTGTVTCSSETAFGNFVADAVKKSQGSDLALVPCAVIRGNRIYTKGQNFDAAAVTAEVAPDAKSIQIEVTGLQLLDAVEQTLATAPAVSQTFPQVSGMRIVYDATRPAGQRIVKLTVNGTALDFQKTYRVATTEDMLKSLTALAAAKRVEGQQPLIATDVVAHLQEVGVRDIKVLGRIKSGK